MGKTKEVGSVIVFLVDNGGWGGGGGCRVCGVGFLNLDLEFPGN